MRVFIAIEFTDDIKQFLWEKQQEVKKYCTKGNFTYKENFHLTLRFIGEVEQKELLKLRAAIDEAASSESPFELVLEKLGQFPRGSRRILWIGLKHSGKLQQLYQTLENTLERQGYEKEERGYNAHITLGREVQVENLEVLDKDVVIEPQVLFVKGISLMESARVEGRLTYRPIYTASFSK